MARMTLSGNRSDSRHAELAAAAAEAAGLAAEAAVANEHGRRLTPDLVEALRGRGLLRLCVPDSLSGPQAPPDVTLRCAQIIARGDGSTGWCVSIAATSSLLSAYLPADAAAEVFGAPESVAAGVWAPTGVSVPADGGYRVSGRWAYCSGITHSGHLFAGTVVKRGPDAGDGPPELRIAALPVTELEVLDTWHTSGLRGTGSHDAVADDVFVPASRTLSLLEGPLVVDAPLYRFPIFGFFALSIAAAALGIARGAIDELILLAGSKTGQGSRRTLAERASTQSAVAAAEASWRAAESLFYGAIEAGWSAAQASEPVPLDARMSLRLAATHAVQSAASVTRSMYDLGGGTAIYEDSPLQRRLRDALTATAHFQVNSASWELPGRLLLGQPARIEML